MANIKILYGSDKLREAYPKVNENFNAVNGEVNDLRGRVNNIITTPIDGQAAAQELIDARGEHSTLGERLDEFDSHMADNAYIAPELLNGWENSSTDFRLAGYIKDAHGYVHLTGVIASGVTTPGTTLFNLPLGYRPSRALQIPAFTNGGALIGGVLITILGDVQILSGGNIGFSLCGISFKV